MKVDLIIAGSMCIIAFGLGRMSGAGSAVCPAGITTSQLAPCATENELALKLDNELDNCRTEVQLPTPLPAAPA